MIGTLSNLNFIVRNNPGHFIFSLLELSDCPWLDLTVGEFEKKYNQIRCAIKDSGPSGLSRLFDLYLITKSLLDEKQPPWVKPFISNNIKIEQYLGISSEQLAGGTWQMVPILVTGNNNAHIKKMIVGRLTCGPDPGLVPAWAESLFDQAFLESARTALELTIGLSFNQAINPTLGHFMLYPLTLANNQVQFKGRSGSLALALG